MPLFRLLSGSDPVVTTDITISVNDPETMAADNLEAVGLGYGTLKIKVGTDASADMARMKAIRAAVGLDIEFVEQPVHRLDLAGLKQVTDNVGIPVLADESVMSPMDAVTIMQMRAADLVNIKLMKTSGIRNALRICSAAEVYGVPCMIGCMLEAKVSVTAAVHLAAARRIITKIDLDGPVLCSEDPVAGGAVFENSRITLPDTPGLGITDVRGVEFN